MQMLLIDVIRILCGAWVDYRQTVVVDGVVTGTFRYHRFESEEQIKHLHFQSTGGGWYVKNAIYIIV